jgi:AcrR family transcriptional regulator
LTEWFIQLCWARMPRTRPSQRLDDIAEAALRVFLAKGYRRARMDEVAREAGVSPGLLYSYVTGKEALYQLVVQRELGVDLSRAELPIPEPDAAAAAALREEAIRQVGPVKTLGDALRTDQPADAKTELEGIVGEFYDRLHRSRRFVQLAERSALDWPEMAEQFYEQGRRPFVQWLGEYIAQRVRTGHFAPVAHPQVAARFVIETVSWFAYHRYGDHDGAGIDDRVARATVVQLVAAGLIGEPRRGRLQTL